MGASEKFCLRWNDFESNISVAFREIRDEKDFFDVTLACGDRQIQAHKLILSACSPFFRGVLRRNPHAHPLLYLKGVDYSDLQAVLNFMYHGEVNVAQEELNSFLAVAEDLKVKGLTQNNQNSSSGSDNAVNRDPPKPKTDPTPRPRPVHRDISDRDPSPGPAPKRPRPSPAPHQPPPVHHTPSLPPYNPSNDDDDDIQEVVPIVKSEPPSTVAVDPTPPPSHTPGYGPGTVAQNMDDSYGDDGYDYSGYDEAGGEYDGSMMEAGADGNKGLNSVISSMIETIEDWEGRKSYSCSACGKITFQLQDMRCHIESKHVATTKIPCPVCGLLYKNRNSLKVHKSMAHRNERKNEELDSYNNSLNNSKNQ